MPSIVSVNVSQTAAPTPSTLQSTGAFISQGATITAPGTGTLLTQLSDLTPILNGALTLSSLTWVGGVVTATAAGPHGFTIGDTLDLTIAGVAPTAYNGTYLCTVTTTTAFTYPLASSPGTETIPGTYTVEDVAELNAMATQFFAQGSSTAVYVLELGPGNAADGVIALTAYITANPVSNYTPGAAGYFYGYALPRAWADEPTFLNMVADFESTTAKTYFFTTMNPANYKNFTPQMKCVVGLIEAPQLSAYRANTLLSISYASGTGLVTASTATAHGVNVDDWVQIDGCVPIGYNGFHQAVIGTAGSTLIYAVTADPGAETTLGTLVGSTVTETAVPSNEFSLSAGFYNALHYAPSTTNMIAPYAFSFLYGVSAFPTSGFGTFLAGLKEAGVNVVGSGAEGGLSNRMMLWGTTMDNRDFTYWYSVDWVQINLDLDLSNEIINGSNNPQAPLYYNQNGINRLLARAQATMNRGVSFGLVLPPVAISAVPFADYVRTNESDYKAGIYRGLAVTYTPQRGFLQITVNVDITDFPLG